MLIIEITYKVVECFLLCRRFFVKKIGKIKINNANMSNKYMLKHIYRMLCGYIIKIN